MFIFYLGAFFGIMTGICVNGLEPLIFEFRIQLSIISIIFSEIIFGQFKLQEMIFVINKKKKEGHNTNK